VTKVCNLCGSSEAKILFRPQAYPDGYIDSVLRCLRCGLVYRNSNAQRVNEDIQLIRKRGYPDRLTAGKMQIFQDYVEVISSFRERNRVLDVGSGEGFFLHLCEKNHWQVWGIEINPDLVDMTRKQYGISVFRGNLEEARHPANFFDVVTFWNVLEHLNEPDKTLKEAYKILRPGGGLFIRVANATFHIPCRWLFVKLYRIYKKSKRFNHSVIHRYSFNRSTIYKYLEKIGFINIDVQNARSAWTSEIRKTSKIQNKIWPMVEKITEIVKVTTNGSKLIGSSLFVTAVKPA
jgi:ubiquinone/menaquinone biosynthesis C-methylase UbiE